MKSIIFASCLTSLLLFFSYESQAQHMFRDLRVNTKSIQLIDGGYPWEYDAASEDDPFNHFIFTFNKDSSKVELLSIIQHFLNAGTRNILFLDSLSRPTKFTGNRQFDEVEFIYVWKWDENGRLMEIEEYYKGKLKKSIRINE